MVKLSAKFLIRKNKANKYFLIREKNDSDKQFLNRITHLPLQHQFIEQILKINDCVNVKFLYLQYNLLKGIENMENFPNLTHLFLQRNFLVKMENLQPLTNLKKIYLGLNEIQVLEGVENLKNLAEIHLEDQDIAIGGTLYFEPLSIQSLGETLQVLNISENRLTSIKGLKNLVSLRILLANDNFLLDIDDITTTISNWHFLQKLSLFGNEVTKSRWYRDSIIFASKSLEILDNTPIHENTRIFIEKLIEHKRKLYMKHKSRKEKRKTLKFADDFETKESCFDFADSFPLLKPAYIYHAWRLRTNVNSVNPQKFLPRPYWKKGGIQSKQDREKLYKQQNLSKIIHIRSLMLETLQNISALSMKKIKSVSRAKEFYLICQCCSNKTNPKRFKKCLCQSRNNKDSAGTE